MNDINLIITVSLLAIGLASVIFYTLGVRHGVSSERQESEYRHGSIAAKQLAALEFRKLD